MMQVSPEATLYDQAVYHGRASQIVEQIKSMEDKPSRKGAVTDLKQTLLHLMLKAKQQGLIEVDYLKELENA